MKKLISALMSIIMVLSMITVPAMAKVGDVIGTALHTDIVAYVNHYAIPSYAVNGTSVIVAEDLRNFGFDVNWNGTNRTLSISRNSNTYVNQMSFTKAGATGAKFTDILETDIKVYAEGQLVTSYAMNGYTMIPVEELTMLGSVNWVEGERALKMWVDGLVVRNEKQNVTNSTASSTVAAPSYTSSAFNTLKSFIVNNGKYQNNYAYYVLRYDDDHYASVSYYFDDDKIYVGMISETDKGSEFYYGLHITNDGDNPWAYITFKSYYGSEENTFFDYKNGRWYITSSTSSTQSTDYDLMMTVLSLFDTYLSRQTPVSLADFGITY